MSPSTRHMTQWETARLEAESRLSKETTRLIQPTGHTTKTENDFFLKMWNSEVGESFRNLNKIGAETEGEISACQSPISQSSSSTKNGSVSGTTTEVCLTAALVAESPSLKNERSGNTDYKNIISNTDYFTARSYTSSTDDLEDPTSTLQLLWDYPGSNDMSFLEGHTYNYDIYPALPN